MAKKSSARAIPRKAHKSGLRGKTPATALDKAATVVHVRTYASQASRDNGNFSWQLSSFSEDSELRIYLRELRRRSRTLFRVNPYIRKYSQALTSNVIGSEGYTLQMQCQEEEDRVIAVADKTGEREGELALYNDLEREFNEKIFERYTENKRVVYQRSGGFLPPDYPEFKTVALWQRDDAGSVVVKKGAPDVYANTLIERQFALWQRAENCTVTRKMNYQRFRELRINTTARDGNILIRKVTNFKNDFKFALQFIPCDYLDLDLNLPASNMRNGNEIRMGVERTPLGEDAAYWIIANTDQDWLFASDYWTGGKHIRIPASEIIHSVRVDDVDATLSPPWITSVMSKLYQLDAFEEAEVRAARESACKGGYIERQAPNDYVGDYTDPDGTVVDLVEPGTSKILGIGEKFVAYDPKHPNQNFGEFRKAVLRSIAAGLRTSYNLLANDLEGVNYSSMRSGALDERENWMALQTWDIDTNEIPVFEAWLEAAMLCGRVPLPFAKFEKFNRPMFQGRRWKWVDPLKDAEGYQLLLKLGLITRTGILAEQYTSDFEENAMQLEAEDTFLRLHGLDCLTLAALNAVPAVAVPKKPDEPAETPPKKKTKKAAKTSE